MCGLPFFQRHTEKWYIKNVDLLCKRDKERNCRGRWMLKMICFCYLIIWLNSNIIKIKFSFVLENSFSWLRLNPYRSLCINCWKFGDLTLLYGSSNFQLSLALSLLLEFKVNYRQYHFLEEIDENYWAQWIRHFLGYALISLNFSYFFEKQDLEN